MTSQKHITVNGESRQTSAQTIADLVAELSLDPAKVAVERNREIVPRSTLAEVKLDEGDELEIVHFVGGGSGQAASNDDKWSVAGRTFKSRLIIGFRRAELHLGCFAGRGAPCECQQPQCADANRLHRSQEGHLSSQYCGMLQR